MTVKASTNRLFTKNFLTNFTYKIKSNFRVMIILFVLHLVAAPLNLINLIVYKLRLGQYELAVLAGNTDLSRPDMNRIYPVIGVVTTVLAAVSVLIVGMSIFNYLYRKSVVDMTLSLPMTTTQRFFSDFLAGGFVYIVPFLAASVLSLLINACGASIVADWDSGLEYPHMTSTLITLIIAGFFILLMAYTLTVLVHTCCGSTFEVLGYTILANGLIPATIAVMGYIFLGNLYGIDLSTNILPLIEKTSPIGGVIMLFSDLDNYYYANSGTVEYVRLEASWLIPYILITVLFFVGAFFLNKYRKAEQVSKPFVYKAFYYITITALTFCIGVLFTMENLLNNITPLIIITAVIYLIFEVITNRGFRKLYLSALRYVLTIAAVIGLSLSIKITDGFGAVKRIPDAKDVKSVQMNYGGIFNQFGEDSDTFASYTNPENIEAVLRMHKRVLENYEEEVRVTDEYSGQTTFNGSYLVASDTLNNADNIITSVRLTYHLKNGQHFTRIYSLSAEECIQMLSVDTTDEFKENHIAAMIEYYNMRKKYYVNSDPNSNTFAYLEALPYANGKVSKIDNSRMDELILCLAEDIRSLSAKEYFTPTSDVLGYIIFGGKRIAINDNYSNVLLFLKKYGISLPTDTFNHDSLQDALDSNALWLIPPEESKMTVDDTDYYFTSNQKYYYGKDILYDEYGNQLTVLPVPQNNEKLLELLKHVQVNYLTTEPCYSVFLNGETYIIPPKYNALAEELYREAIGATESNGAA